MIIQMQISNIRDIDGVDGHLDFSTASSASMASSSVPAASTDVNGDHQHQQPHARPPHVMAMAAKESTLVDF
jgi:hypothetical protein